MRLRTALAASVASLALAGCAVLAPPTPTATPASPSAGVPRTAAATAAGPPAPAATPIAASTPAGVAPEPVAPVTPAAPTPTIDSPEGELARVLANPPPKRDVVDLARRFRVKPGTPTPMATPAAPPPPIGDVREFWVADSLRHRYFRARARLLARSEHADFYVQEGEKIDETAVRKSLDTFEQRIVPTIVRDFAADKLSVDALKVALLNVRLGGLVGYYSSADEHPSWAVPYSNERPLIVMSLASVQPGTRGYDSGLAHEFEHFVQWRLDPGEDTWVNEGTAELAIRAVGLDPSGNFSGFLSQPDVQLNDWAEQIGATPSHYGASELFFHYLADRFGGYRVVGSILARPERGAAGVDAALGALAKTGEPASFDAAFLDWSIANWANQADPADTRYRYPDLPGVHVKDETISAVPTRVAESVHQYAARYYALPTAAAGADLAVASAPTTVLVPAPSRPGSFWWSNRSDSGDSRLTRELDLTRVNSATLRFATWYDLERDFDYAYVAASTDGGATWVTLPGRYSTAADPNGANLGVGYTGKSGGSAPAEWVDESVDLSAYAGRRVLLRFEVVTDDAYNGAGFCVDDMRVDEIGWRDGPEAAGWQAEGFLRIANRIPERLDVRIVGLFGHEVRLYPVPLDRDGAGRVRLPDELSQADRAAVVVTSHTPITPAPVDFALTFERGP